MTAEEAATFLLSLPEAMEDHPFGFTPDVYKVGGKIFAILSGESEAARLSLKCEPGLALELRDRYPAVTAGYHLNKRHWNTVVLDGSVPDDAVEGMIRHSYERVVSQLPKAERQALLGP